MENDGKFWKMMERLENGVKCWKIVENVKKK